jgi:hypothetical protein
VLRHPIAHRLLRVRIEVVAQRDDARPIVVFETLFEGVGVGEIAVLDVHLHSSISPQVAAGIVANPY